jgi:probable HAF family extracellular repeat protein
MKRRSLIALLILGGESMRKLSGIVFSAVLLLIGSTQGTWAQKNKVWELGTYPGGTWFTTESINDLGVVVGRGDVPPIGSDGVGYTHPLAVPLFGPHAGEWIDLGTLGGEESRGWELESLTQISNTGLVVSHSTAPDGYVHGVAWTRGTGMVDLGTLADTGNPAYADYKWSYAQGTNKLGTLIVGVSQITDVLQLPVVWTPAGKPRGPASVWKIHRLDTTAELPYGQAWSVNDSGQIIGWGNGVPAVTGVVWNPRADGKGWQLTPLPPSPDPDYNTCAFGINDWGEITGVVISGDFSIWLPRLWKPIDMKRTKYSQPIELALPGGFTSCESVGLNELGDIVGDCWNDQMDLPAHWITAHPTFSEIIKFPGSWGYSWGVNNSRFASVTYADSKKCPADTYGSCGGAVQFHSK